MTPRPVFPKSSKGVQTVQKCPRVVQIHISSVFDCYPSFASLLDRFGHFVGSFLGFWLCKLCNMIWAFLTQKNICTLTLILTKCCSLFCVQMMRAQKQLSPARQINVRGTRHKLGLANVCRPKLDIMRKSLATLLTLILARAKNYASFKGNGHLWTCLQLYRSINGL